MPKFPLEYIERLREAGLEVRHSYDELEDHQVNEYQGRLSVSFENHKLWLFSHGKQWVTEYSGPSPADFVKEFDTPDEAVEDALKFFAHDERWTQAEEFLQYTEHKLPSNTLEKAVSSGLRWERMTTFHGYEFFKGDNPVSSLVCKGSNGNTWMTFQSGEESKVEAKEWSTADEAVDEVIRVMVGS